MLGEFWASKCKLNQKESNPEQKTVGMDVRKSMNNNTVEW